MEPLANLENGLTARSLRQLYVACVTSIADYAGPVWFMGKRSLAPLRALRSKAARKILGFFRTAPNEPCELEARLLPPAMCLERQCISYVVRVRDKLTDGHLVSKALRETQRLTDKQAKQNKLTRLQDLRFWQSFARGEKELSRASLRTETLRAWKTHFDKVRQKRLQSTSNPNSYWSRFEWQEKLEIPRAPRKTTSAYYALKMGYGYLQNYLYRLHLGDNDRCRCGGKETAEHLLFRCSIYS